MLERICELAAARGLPALLIGGHAVIAHGYPRNTFDVDFVIQAKELEGWKGMLEHLGYTLLAETSTFLQMAAPDERTLPVDLMLVNETTFTKMLALARECAELPPGARVVSLEHLLALKCHAIKHGHPGCVEKHVEDVKGIVRANRLDMTTAGGGLSFQSMVRPNYMKKREEPDNKSLLELDLPDWSQMRDPAERVTPAAALSRIEEYYRMFPHAAKTSREQRVMVDMPEFEL